MNPPPSASFLRDANGHFHLSCNACKRDGLDCGTDRNKISSAARSNGYKLVPGLGWVCLHCFWATDVTVSVQGSIETNPS